jgi:hypothetical protein
MIIDIFEQGGFREILDREHLAEHGFQPLVLAGGVGFVQLQKLVIRSALNLDEVRHLRDFLNLAEILAKPFASGEGESHSLGSFTAIRPCLPEVGTSSFNTNGKCRRPLQ